MSDQRLTELEIKFAHQDDLLERLNQVICEQQKTIETLEAKVKALIQKIDNPAGTGVPRNEKPPHY